MSLFERIRSALNGERVCPPEHLASYQRLGQELYGVEVELADSTSEKSRAYLRAAKCFQVMADALLKDAYDLKAVPAVTHDQADEWYGQITELMIAARQEHAFSNSAKVPLPVHIGRRIEPSGKCPDSHLMGMRRAADNVEALLTPALTRAKIEGEKFKSAILMYEEARTRRQVGDAIVGAIANGQRIASESHEEGEDQYWSTLATYLLVAQGLEFPTCLERTAVQASMQSFRRCKLDSNDIWKVTSETAKREIRRAGEWRKAEEDLAEHWSLHTIAPVEREYETTAEELVAKGHIKEDGYWYCCPFQPTYRVVADEIYILQRRIPRGHVFVWEYGDDGAPGHFITARSFNAADSRQYCED